MQGSVSAAVKLIETNHIPAQDIADEEVLITYLLKMKPKDAILELVSWEPEIVYALCYCWFSLYLAIEYGL